MTSSGDYLSRFQGICRIDAFHGIAVRSARRLSRSQQITASTFLLVVDWSVDLQPGDLMRIASRLLTPPFSFLLLMLASLTLVLPSNSQTPPPDPSPATNTGTNPYETYGGERENINLGTGDLNVPLTLLHLPGRNGHDLVVKMAFDSKVWQLHGSFDQTTDTYYFDWERDGGWS